MLMLQFLNQCMYMHSSARWRPVVIIGEMSTFLTYHYIQTHSLMGLFTAHWMFCSGVKLSRLLWNVWFHLSFFLHHELYISAHMHIYQISFIQFGTFSDDEVFCAAWWILQFVILVAQVNLQCAGQLVPWSGALLCLQQLSLRIWHPWLWARLFNDQPQCPSSVGGSVWRLRQHRPVHHWPVHLERPVEVGEAVWSCDAAAPRNGGNGPWTQFCQVEVSHGNISNCIGHKGQDPLW